MPETPTRTGFCERLRFMDDLKNRLCHFTYRGKAMTVEKLLKALEGVPLDAEVKLLVWDEPVVLSEVTADSVSHEEKVHNASYQEHSNTFLIDAD